MLRNKLLCGPSVAALTMLLLSSGAMAADIEIGTSETRSVSATGSPQSVFFTGAGTLTITAPTADPIPPGGESDQNGYGGYNQTFGYNAYGAIKNILTSADNQGTVNIEGRSYTTYIGANLGADASLGDDPVASNAHSLAAVNILGGTVDLDNEFYNVDLTTIANGATLTICGGDLGDPSCQLVNGGILNNGTITGAFTTGSGIDLTNNGTMTGDVVLGTASNLILGSGSSLTGNVTTAGGLVNVGGTATLAGHLALNGGSLRLLASGGSTLNVNTLTTSSGSSIVTLITGDGNTSGVGSANLGRITASGAVVLANGTTVTPDLSSYSEISDGARYILASGGSAASMGNVATTNTGLYIWRVLLGNDATLGQSANDIYLVASRVSMGNLVESLSQSGAAGRNAFSVAAVMDGLVNSDKAAAQAVNTQLGSLASSSPAAAQSALKSMAPDVTGGAVQATTSAATAVSNVISSHSDAIRLVMTDGQTGIATGDALRGLGVWAQPFGFHAVQGMRKGIDGYDVNSGGLAAGIDTQVTDRVRAGLALSYANTSVDGRNDASGNSTDIDSYQATLYAAYQGSPWYVDAQIGYGYNQYDSKRRAIVGTIGEVAKGDFDGNQFSAKLGGGYPIVAGRFTFTPNASLSYIHLNQDSYSESNAPTLGLNVSSYSTHSLKSGLGSKLSTTFDVADGKLTPEVSATWQHEFHDVAPTTTAQFAFGGSSFRSQGAEQETDAAVLGLGLTYTKGPYSISAQYDAELKSDYVGQTGLIKARIEF